MLLAAVAQWGKANPELVLPVGFSYKRVRRRVELAADGRLLSRRPLDLATLEEKTGPRRLAPDITRTSGPRALLVTDKASYVFGPRPMVNYTAEALGTAAREHAAYITLLDECLARTGHTPLSAVRAFVAEKAYQQLELPDDWSDDDFIEFSVDGRDPLLSPDVRAFWAQHAMSDVLSSTYGQCMVCGKFTNLLTKFPQLKGIPGSQSSGTPLISFNKNAHEHYGRPGSLNAPICFGCAATSHGALAVLLLDERHSKTIGPFRWVWWTLGADEVPFDELLLRADPAEVAALLSSPFAAKPVGTRGTGHFLAAALGGNKGRAVVRSWVDVTLPEVRANLSNWFKRQSIVRPDGSPPRYLTMTELLEAAAPSLGGDNPTNNDAARRLLPSLVESALLGQHVPLALWQGAIGRIRATEKPVNKAQLRPGDLALFTARKYTRKKITYAQAAVLKLALLADNDPQPEVTMACLEPDRNEPAYQCGRLLSILDQAQRAALGRLNATVVDRFYGSASSSPSTSLPALMRAAQAHLAKLRKRRPGWAVAYDTKLTEILSHIDHFPNQLTMREQAEFALGFYHQRAADIAEAKAAKEHGMDEAPAAEDEIPETEED